jgi:hypothetical protein
MNANRPFSITELTEILDLLTRLQEARLGDTFIASPIELRRGNNNHQLGSIGLSATEGYVWTPALTE